MLHAGLRVSEVIAVSPEALTPAARPDAPARPRVLGKGGKERIVCVHQQAMSALAAWQSERPPADTPQLFVNQHGQPLTVSGVQWLLKGYGAQIGVHLTPHRLCHTYARRLAEAHMPIQGLSSFLGHAQISTTQIYLAGADPGLAATFDQAMRAIAVRAAQSTAHQQHADLRPALRPDPGAGLPAGHGAGGAGHATHPSA